MRFMREDEALKTMSLFEGAIETERISKKALRNWLVSKLCLLNFVITFSSEVVQKT